jgi:hypothetical protein
MQVDIDLMNKTFESYSQFLLQIRFEQEGINKLFHHGIYNYNRF